MDDAEEKNKLAVIDLTETDEEESAKNEDVFLVEKAKSKETEKKTKKRTMVTRSSKRNESGKKKILEKVDLEALDELARQAEIMIDQEEEEEKGKKETGKEMEMGLEKKVENQNSTVAVERHGRTETKTVGEMNISDSNSSSATIESLISRGCDASKENGKSKREKNGQAETAIESNSTEKEYVDADHLKIKCVESTDKTIEGQESAQKEENISGAINFESLMEDGKRAQQVGGFGSFLEKTDGQSDDHMAFNILDQIEDKSSLEDLWDELTKQTRETGEKATSRVDTDGGDDWLRTIDLEASFVRESLEGNSGKRNLVALQLWKLTEPRGWTIENKNREVGLIPSPSDLQSCPNASWLPLNDVNVLLSIMKHWPEIFQEAFERAEERVNKDPNLVVEFQRNLKKEDFLPKPTSDDPDACRSPGESVAGGPVSLPSTVSNGETGCQAIELKSIQGDKNGKPKQNKRPSNLIKDSRKSFVSKKKIKIENDSEELDKREFGKPRQRHQKKLPSKKVLKTKIKQERLQSPPEKSVKKEPERESPPPICYKFVYPFLLKAKKWRVVGGSGLVDWWYLAPATQFIRGSPIGTQGRDYCGSKDEMVEMVKRNETLRKEYLDYMGHSQ